MNPSVMAQIGFSLSSAGEGTAILIIGVTALLLAASRLWSNPLGAISTLMSVLLFVMGAVLDMGIELYWLGVMGTVVILIAGLVVRVGR